MQRNWRDISYLATGTPRQQAAYTALTRLGLCTDLQAYDPVLIGTIPLAIDIAGSDLDIACEAHDLAAFARQLIARYRDAQSFRLAHKSIRDLPTVVATFRYADFDVQLFAQPQPVVAQYGYRHLLVEARLLALGGERARQTIRRLKGSGMKTEPAFARYFGLSGDAYERLWALSFLDGEGLRQAMGNYPAP